MSEDLERLIASLNETDIEELMKRVNETDIEARTCAKNARHS